VEFAARKTAGRNRLEEKAVGMAFCCWLFPCTLLSRLSAVRVSSLTVKVIPWPSGSKMSEKSF
jgi:hypothetical protein